MPALHDILCGALDFLWRPWGSVEIWGDAITCELRKKGIVTQLNGTTSAATKAIRGKHKAGPKLGRRAEFHAQAHAL